MRIDSVSVAGFRCFAAPVVLDFAGPPGLVLVTGINQVNPDLAANGIGKSTLFDAITFCFYGRTGRGGKGPSLVNTALKGPAEVIVTGEIGDQAFALTRRQSPNKLTLQVGADNEHVVTQETLDQFLPLTYEQFLRSIYHVQGSIGFIGLKPQPMLDELSGYLDLDVYDAARENANRRWASASAKGNSAQSTLDHDLKTMRGIEDQYEDLMHKSHSAVRERLRDARHNATALSAARVAHSTAQRRLQRWQRTAAARDTATTQRQLDDARRNAARCDRDVARLASQLDDLAKLKSASICPTCGQKWDRHAELGAKRRQLRAELGDCIARATAAKDAVAELEAALLTDRVDNATLQAKVQAEVTALASDIERLTRERDRIFNRGNPFDDLIDKSQHLLVKLKKQVAHSQVELATAREEEAVFGYWRKGFKLLKISVVASVLAHFQAVANALLQELGMAGWSIAINADSALDSKGKLEVSIVHANGAVRSVEDLSFGELQRVKIACDVAVGDICLAAAGVDSNVEFWDEPTTWLSEQGVAMFLLLLEKRAVTLQRRIFVADHRTLAHSWQEVLTITKTEQGSTLSAQATSHQNVQRKPRPVLRVPAAS